VRYRAGAEGWRGRPRVGGCRRYEGREVTRPILPCTPRASWPAASDLGSVGAAGALSLYGRARASPVCSAASRGSSVTRFVRAEADA